MHRRVQATAIVTWFVLAMLSGRTPAMSADAPDSASNKAWFDSLDIEQLGDVIVTAQRREEKLQDVPVAVTVLDRTQLDRRAIRDAVDLSGAAPSLIVAPMSLTGNGALIWLRGFGTLNPEKTNDPPVNIYIDGVYLGTNTGQLLRTFDFERMEILRGVQGTLFGKNASGGAINITRSRPSGDTINGHAAVTVGSHGRNDYQAVLNAPIVQDKFWIKLAGISENDNGYMKNVANPDYQGARNYKSGNLTAVFKPSDRIDVDIAYDHIDDRSDPIPHVQGFTATALPLPVIVPGGGPLTIGPYMPCVRFNLCAMPTDKNEANSNGPAMQRYMLNAVTTNITLHLEKLDLVSITGWRQSDDEVVVDFDATPQTFFHTRRQADYNQVTQELRAVSKNTGRFNYVAGVYLFNSNFHSAQDVMQDTAYSSQTATPGTLTYPGFRSGQFARSWAVYAQADYKVTDKLKLTMGGRYTHDYKKFELRRFSFSDHNFGGPLPLTGLLASAFNADTFTPRAGADYRFSQSFMAYFSYSKGYNSGGFNPGGTNAFNIGPYGAEHIDDFELGVKVDLFDQKLRLNANGYHIDYRGKQLSVVTADPIVGASSQIRNVGNLTMNGVGLEAAALLRHDLRVSGSFSYMNARYTKFLAQIQAGQPITDNTSLTPVRTPKITASGTVDYTITTRPGDITLSTIYRYQDRYQLDAINSPQGWTKPGSVIDLSAAFDFTRGKAAWRLSAFVKNVTDRIYPIQLTQAGNFLDEKALAEGRSFGATLGVRF